MRYKCLECSHEFDGKESQWLRCHKCSSHLVFDPAKDGKPRIKMYADIIDIDPRRNNKRGKGRSH